MAGSSEFSRYSITFNSYESIKNQKFKIKMQASNPPEGAKLIYRIPLILRGNDPTELYESSETKELISKEEMEEFYKEIVSSSKPIFLKAKYYVFIWITLAILSIAWFSVVQKLSSVLGHLAWLSVVTALLLLIVFLFIVYTLPKALYQHLQEKLDTCNQSIYRERNLEWHLASNAQELQLWAWGKDIQLFSDQSKRESSSNNEKQLEEAEDNNNNLSSSP